MPPKFKKGEPGRDQDRVHLLDLDSSDEEEEKIFVNSSPNIPHQSARERQIQDPKIRHVQNQVTGVISIMKENISKVIDRGEKLETLEEKSDGLAESASHFRHSSKRLQRKAWWQQCRLKLIITGVILLIIIIVIIIIVVKSRP